MDIKFIFFYFIFSNHFRICFTKLKLLLVAVELSNEEGTGSHLSINPGSMVRIEPGTRGFFIAGSNDEIRR